MAQNASLDVVNPRTGQVDYHIAPLDDQAVAATANRLRDGQSAWSALSVAQRGAILHQWADGIEANLAVISRALIDDTGRSGISKIEAIGVVRSIRRWADRAPAMIADRMVQNVPTAVPDISTSTRLVPYPLVGVISPWNFPLTLALIDAVPALMAGCAVIIKPSEITPRFSAPLLETIRAIPQLSAILAIIQGGGETGAALVQNVDYICFTGSVATGRKVGESAARQFIPASLELGGKDPMIIMASADPETAADIALRACIVNSGQACQSIERIYLARTISEPFINSLTDKAAKVRLNYPDIQSGDIGPFIFAKQADIVQRQIDDASQKGAEILCGGTVETLGGGKYLRPTVLTNVTADMAIMTAETFGPVIPVTIFDDIDEAVMLANSGEFGLSAAVIAATAAEAEDVAAQLEAGAVSINDGALTSMISDAEKSSFGLSGIGASRMGDSGMLRFLRRQALIRQSGRAAPMAAYSEDALN